MLKTKTYTATVKAAGDDLGDGEFEALVSVFGNVDSYGDVVMAGAFAENLEQWKASGNPIPVIWSHQWYDPDYHIGEVLKATETDDGLVVRARIDFEAPKANQVWRLLKGKRVTQFSFAFDVDDAGWGERDGERVYELRKLSLFEVGPTLVGANQETDLLATGKGALAPDVAEQIRAVVRDELAKTADSGQATEPAPANEEEPARANSEEPVKATPVAAVELHTALAELDELTG